MNIAAKCNYNHPGKDKGDPRLHPDWEKWKNGNEKIGVDHYYCKLNGQGNMCPECKYWLKCIQQQYSYQYLISYLNKGGDHIVPQRDRKRQENTLKEIADSIMKIDLEIDKLKEQISKQKRIRTNKWADYLKVYNTFKGGQTTIPTKKK